MIFFCAAAFLASRSIAGAGVVGVAGVGGAVLAPFCCVLNANLAFTSATFALAAAFLFSSSDMPFVSGAAAGEPLLDRMRFESCSSLSIGNGRFPVLLAMSVVWNCVSLTKLRLRMSFLRIASARVMCPRGTLQLYARKTSGALAD